MIEEENLYEFTNDFERERASYAYVASLVSFGFLLPLPIINLLASIIYSLANYKSSYFIRWHCMQVLVSQIVVVIINSLHFYWLTSILFADLAFTPKYFAYLVFVVLYNIYEFVITYRAAVKVRKGIHIRWGFWGNLASLLCKQKRRT